MSIGRFRSFKIQNEAPKKNVFEGFISRRLVLRSIVYSSILKYRFWPITKVIGDYKFRDEQKNSGAANNEKGMGRENKEPPYSPLLMW